jgi:hypothetical protein
MPKIFTTVGRGVADVLTLGAAEIPVGKSTLGVVTGVTPVVTATVSAGITSGLQPGQSVLGIPSKIAKPVIESTAKAGAIIAGVSAAGLPLLIAPLVAGLGTTALNSVAQLDTAPKATAVATAAPRPATAIPIISSSQPVDPNAFTTYYPQTSVSPGGGGIIAGDASIDPALFDYYNKPQQTQPADWKPLIMVGILAIGAGVLLALARR